MEGRWKRGILAEVRLWQWELVKPWAIPSRWELVVSELPSKLGYVSESQWALGYGILYRLVLVLLATG